MYRDSQKDELRYRARHQQRGRAGKTGIRDDILDMKETLKIVNIEAEKGTVVIFSLYKDMEKPYPNDLKQKA